MNSPPRLPTPATSSSTLVALLTSGQIALIDQVADRDLVGDVGKQPLVALVQHAAVEPIGRCGKPITLRCGLIRASVSRNRRYMVLRLAE